MKPLRKVVFKIPYFEMMCAIIKNRANRVREILDSGQIKIDQTIPNDDEVHLDLPLVIYCLEENSQEIAKLLVEEYGAEINPTEKFSTSAIEYAHKRGLMDFVKFCIEKECVNYKQYLDKCEYSDDQKMLFAAKEGDFDTVFKYLDNKNTDVNAMNMLDNERGLLYYAVEQDNLSIIQTLIEKYNANKYKIHTFIESCHINAEQLSKCLYRFDIIDFLSNPDFPYEKDDYIIKASHFSHALHSRDLDYLKELIFVKKYGKEIRLDSYYASEDLLQAACRLGFFEAFKFLFEECEFSLLSFYMEENFCIDLAWNNQNYEILVYLLERAPEEFFENYEEFRSTKIYDLVDL